MFDPKLKERKALGVKIAPSFKAPFRGAVKVEILFYFSSKDKSKWGNFKITKSDLDNNLKGYLDLMEGYAYENDSQVASIIAQKKYAEFDSTHIFVSEI